MENVETTGMTIAEIEQRFADEDEIKTGKFSDVPGVVKNYLGWFQAMVKCGFLVVGSKQGHRGFAAGNRQAMVQGYDEMFYQITQKYYRSELWPSVEQVAPLVDNGAKKRGLIDLWKWLDQRCIVHIGKERKKVEKLESQGNNGGLAVVFEILKILGYNGTLQTLAQETCFFWSRNCEYLCVADDFFLMLYQDLYYRHVFNNTQPTLEQRVASWENYVDLFEYLLNCLRPAKVMLPNEWLWNIVDEFVYQYQSFCHVCEERNDEKRNLHTQFRWKLHLHTEEEKELLRTNPQIWSTGAVLKLLSRMVKVSAIEDTLASPTGVVGKDHPDYEFATHPLYSMLGMFALVELSRVHTLHGDYHAALVCFDKVNFVEKNPLYALVTACHVALFFYRGFASMMLRRTSDAVESFTTILLYIARSYKFQQRTSYMYDMVVKKQDKMFNLLAILVAVCPQELDESVKNMLLDRNEDNIARIREGDEGLVKEMFSWNCPKFVDASIPEPGVESVPLGGDGDQTPAFQQQCDAFMHEMRQQLMMPKVRSYLKLYKTIGVEKLAEYLDCSKREFVSHLLAFKHKACCESSSSTGFQFVGDVGFFLNQDDVKIDDSVQERHHLDYFVHGVERLGDLVSDLQAM